MIGIVMVADDKAVIVLPKNIVKYKKKDGKSPFDQWFKKHCNSNIGASIDQALDRVRDGKAIKVKGYGRVSAIILCWPRKIRVYYGTIKGTTVGLLGGDEFNQTEDIENARKYWEDYFSREEEDAKKK